MRDLEIKRQLVRHHAKRVEDEIAELFDIADGCGAFSSRSHRLARQDRLNDLLSDLMHATLAVVAEELADELKGPGA